MRALSIRQPWAWLVVNGYKDIENRTWSTEFRGRVYVHAGQRMEPDDYPEQREHIGRAGIVVPARLARGAIVGEVTITDCLSVSNSPWFCGPYGFLLEDPVAYEQPVPYRGQLGFFAVDENLISQWASAGEYQGG